MHGSVSGALHGGVRGARRGDSRRGDVSPPRKAPRRETRVAMDGADATRGASGRKTPRGVCAIRVGRRLRRRKRGRRLRRRRLRRRRRVRRRVRSGDARVVADGSRRRRPPTRALPLPGRRSERPRRRRGRRRISGSGSTRTSTRNNIRFLSPSSGSSTPWIRRRRNASFVPRDRRRLCRCGPRARRWWRETSSSSRASRRGRRRRSRGRRWRRRRRSASRARRGGRAVDADVAGDGARSGRDARARWTRSFASGGRRKPYPGDARWTRRRARRSRETRRGGSETRG